MKTIDTRRYEMFVRTSNFGVAHGDLFKDSNLAKEQFAIVAAAVTELSGHAVTISAVGDGRSNKVMARDALIEQLDTISHTARGIAEDTPGLEDKFRLPDRENDQALITAGRLFARDAKAFESQFIAHAMAPTFIADLNTLVEQFESAIHDRAVSKEDQVAARTNIKAAVESGLSAVRKLDVILVNQLHGDPGTLAKWRLDRRIAYVRGGRRVRKVPASTPADPAPTTAIPASPVPAAQTSAAPLAVPQTAGGVAETTGVKP